MVFDKYLESSIKKQTRVKRGDTGIIYHIQPEGCIPQNWKQFLAKEENKANLATFYTKYMVQYAGISLVEALYMSGGKGDNTIQIMKNGVVDIESLKLNQEEADTRIVLHAKAASETGANHIVINSPDTDVLVLLLHHRTLICASEIFFLTGREGKHASLTRYIPIHTIFEKLQKNQHNILLSVYCLTGCDTVSSFRGHGKKLHFLYFCRRLKNISPFPI